MQEFEVGTDWSEVNMVFTPPLVLAAELGVTFTVFEGSAVSVYSVSFWLRP